MSTVPVSLSNKRTPEPPPLRHGDRMMQAEFHRRYQAYPEDVKFELIGGVVYMASPLRRPHAVHHPELSGVLWLYQAATPGVEVLDNATIILGEESEPQPDLALRVLPEYGGQSAEDEGQYVVGSPEFLAEVAHSSRDIDLREKKQDYRKAGVLEYLVLCLEEKEIHWFSFKSGGSLKPNRKGVYRSKVFPGLWIDGPALLARDSNQLMAVIQKGLASREHTAFVKRLKAARKKRSSK